MGKLLNENFIVRELPPLGPGGRNATAAARDACAYAQRAGAPGSSAGKCSSLSAPDGAPPAVVAELSTLRALFDATRETIQELADAGCVVKHIERGLVDWYALKDGREILLCWKLGEKSVGSWHELDTGFAGRQSISLL